MELRFDQRRLTQLLLFSQSRRASNFDPAATIDDGTCDVSSCGSGTCDGDLDGNSIINTADLLIFMGAFGTTCP